MAAPGVAAVALAALLDRFVGELPARVHPVALFGRLAAPFDREWVAPRIAGLVVALALPLVAAVVAGGVVAAGADLAAATLAESPAVSSPAASAVSVVPVGAVPASRIAGVALAGLVLFATTSLRMLLSAARDVVALSTTDLDAARGRLPALAGRDPSSLSGGRVRSAAVESAAENLADGLVAPLFAFALGSLVSLPVAAAAAAWVKAVNTLDSMLGYPEKPHGTASARLDDVVMFVPARAAAFLIAVAAADPDAPKRARPWVRRPPSPNSGWPMATLAAAGGVRLEKPETYVLNDAGRLPDAEQARHAVGIVGRAGLLAWVAAGVIAWY